MAMEHVKSKGGDTGNLIHHSDRGCQYASREYVDTLIENNVRISMTEGGDPKDNAQAERINNTMKNELLKGKIFTSVGQVRTEVARVMEFYNNRRPHMSIGMMTPVEARLCSGPLKKLWRSYREENLLRRKNETSSPDASEQWPPSGLRPPVNHCSV